MNHEALTTPPQIIEPVLYHKRRMSATGLLLLNEASAKGESPVADIEDRVSLLSQCSCQYQRRNSISLTIDVLKHDKTTVFAVAEELVRVVPRTIVILQERLGGLRTRINANKYGRQSRALNRHLTRIWKCLSQTVSILRWELRDGNSIQEGSICPFPPSSVDEALSSILYLLFAIIELLQRLDGLLHSLHYKDKCSCLNKTNLIQVHIYLTDALDAFDEAFRVISHAIPLWSGEHV